MNKEVKRTKMSYEIFINWIKDNIFWVLVALIILLILISKKFKAKRLANEEKRKKNDETRKLANEDEEVKQDKVMELPPLPIAEQANVNVGGPFGIEENKPVSPKSSQSLDLKYKDIIHSYKQQLGEDIQKLNVEIKQLDQEAYKCNREYKETIKNINTRNDTMNLKYLDIKSKRNALIEMMQRLDGKQA